MVEEESEEEKISQEDKHDRKRDMKEKAKKNKKKKKESAAKYQKRLKKNAVTIQANMLYKPVYDEGVSLFYENHAYPDHPDRLVL